VGIAVSQGAVVVEPADPIVYTVLRVPPPIVRVSRVRTMIRRRSPDTHVPKFTDDAEKFRVPTVDACSDVKDDVACGVPPEFSRAHATDT
jgi:hypothetical protein